MNHPHRIHRPAPRPQRGAAAVEFALVAVLFFTLLLGVVEMGRLLWVWNAAVETTRFGARMAVVCDIGDADIKVRMTQRMPALTTGQVGIDYLNPPAAANSCTDANCKAVTVSIKDYTHQLIVPLLPFSSLQLPPFSTTLRKEFMNSANNPVCS